MADLEPMEKIAVRVYKSDMDWLRLTYRTVGYNKILRILLRRHRRAVERYLAQKKEDRIEGEHDERGPIKLDELLDDGESLGEPGGDTDDAE